MKVSYPGILKIARDDEDKGYYFALEIKGKGKEELEEMYKFQKAMGNAYNKTKNDFKFDYSRDILHKLQEGKEYTTTFFYKLVAMFILLVTVIIGGFIYLYF